MPGLQECELDRIKAALNAIHQEILENGFIYRFHMDPVQGQVMRGHQRAHPDKNHQGEHASAIGHNETQMAGKASRQSEQEGTEKWP